MKERINEINILRSLAILAVIVQHAIGFFVRQPDIAPSEAVILGLIFNLMKFAVPTFVFVTGLVLFYNYTQIKSYSSFIIKRLREILVPYIFWSVLYLFYYHKITGYDQEAIQLALLSFLTGTAAYHLWFVVMIFQWYLIYPVVLRAFNEVQSRVRSLSGFTLVALVLGLAYTALMWFSATYLPQYYHNTWPTALHIPLVQFRDRNFLFWSFYFIWGGVVGTRLLQWRYFIYRSRYWYIIAFLPTFALVSYQLIAPMQNNLINLGYATSFKPSMFIYTLVQLPLIYLLCWWIGQKSGLITKALGIIGRYSFGIYLSHAMVLNYILQGLKLWLVEHSYLVGAILASLCTALLAGLLTALLARLPLSWLTVGVIRRS